MNIQDVFFYILAGIIALSGVLMVTSRNVFHSASFLAAVLALVAGLYLLLGAEFLAAVQLLVYVGAVVILIIFAVMLTSQLGDPRISQSNRLSLPALVGCVLFLGLFVPALTRYAWVSSEAASQAGSMSNIQSIGRALLTTFAFPFELVSLALLVALIGAIVIARKDVQ